MRNLTAQRSKRLQVYRPHALPGGSINDLPTAIILPSGAVVNITLLARLAACHELGLCGLRRRPKLSLYPSETCRQERGWAP